ncbi:MAG: SAM-dependent methyltransferase [Candidatus Woesearchaeota archaeon]
MKFVIEHLDSRLYKWSFLEYNHISKIVGSRNLIFTNVKSRFARQILENLGKVYKKSVLQMNLKSVCVLDPFAKKTLEPKDRRKFRYLVFGGILGDCPMKRRTTKNLTAKMIFAESRNLGHKQMSTDTAVAVAKRIIDGENLSMLKFKEKLEINLRKGESIILPFRYLVVDDKVLLPDGFIDFLSKRKGF